MVAFPLDPTATGQADDVFYCDHTDMTQDGRRIPISGTSTAQRDREMRDVWIATYEAILAHHRDGSVPFPQCHDGAHVHHDLNCVYCEEADCPPPSSTATATR